RALLYNSHPLFEPIEGRVPVQLGNCACQRNTLWANLHAVLGIPASGDSFLARHKLQSVRRKGFPDRVEVEKERLANGRRPYKLVVFVNLGAGFEATAASHAARKCVPKLPNMVVLGLSHAQIIGTVDGHPALNLLQILEHLASIDKEISNHGKLLHRLESN